MLYIQWGKENKQKKPRHCLFLCKGYTNLSARWDPKSSIFSYTHNECLSPRRPPFCNSRCGAFYVLERPFWNEILIYFLEKNKIIFSSFLNAFYAFKT